MVCKKFIQPREHPSRSSRLSGSTSSGTKWIFSDNIPSEYDWVSDEVLGTPSKVSLSYLEKLKEAKVVIQTSEEGKYELVVPNIEERICYSNRSLETESDWLWEMYFKIRPLPGVTPFYLDVEKNKGFHIYWNYNAFSLRPSLDDLSSEERVVVSILIKLWEVEPLDPKNLFSNEEAARKSIVEMAGGLEAVAAMRQRLLAGNSTTEEGSMSATHSDKDNAQGTSEVVKTGPSPPSSPPRKKKKKEKEENEKLKRDAKSASEKREAAEKQVSELQGKLKEFEEQRLSLAKFVADAEKAAVDGVAQTEKNIKDQCALIAPDIDFSGVSAYKKVVNGEVIEL
ncbi:hypothetical protein PIB30_024747 [Stylosanthes scabra]|uniref:Uncharacterized protein n=1 Tax=Stylosanthes scabra TaxID=79078 RepID=A0ABU6TBT0_9FABA|nr:hypothetical protein [Stylosanthes scabra]